MACFHRTGWGTMVEQKNCIAIVSIVFDLLEVPAFATVSDFSCELNTELSLLSRR